MDVEQLDKFDEFRLWLISAAFSGKRRAFYFHGVLSKIIFVGVDERTLIFVEHLPCTRH